MKAFALMLLLVSVSFVAGEAKVGPVAPDGTEPQLDLPASLHLKNKGGSDGAGLCVFTSLNHSAYWHNIPWMQDFREYMTKFPGGGWPEKVKQKIIALAKSKGVASPEQWYEDNVIQVEANNLEILKLACRTGRMPGITYSYSPTGHYGGRKIAHMVTLVHAGPGADGKVWYCVLDNNYPDVLEWMDEGTFRKVYSGGGTGWAVIFRQPGPPPCPLN